MVTPQKIVWDDSARASLRNAVMHIKKDSPQNAVKVKDDILDEIGSLLRHPEKYATDRYKSDNDGNFRAF